MEGVLGGTGIQNSEGNGQTVQEETSVQHFGGLGGGHGVERECWIDWDTTWGMEEHTMGGFSSQVLKELALPILLCDNHSSQALQPKLYHISTTNGPKCVILG